MSDEYAFYLKERMRGVSCESEKCLSHIVQDAWDALHAGRYDLVPDEVRTCFTASSKLLAQKVAASDSDFILERAKWLDPIGVDSIESQQVRDRVGVNVNRTARIHELHIADDQRTEHTPEVTNGILSKQRYLEDSAKDRGVPEVSSEVTLVEFQNLFLARRPFILRKFCNHIPAIKLWNDAQFWKEALGPCLVPVEVGGYLSEDFMQVMVSMNEYIEFIMSPVGDIQIYLAQLDIARSLPALDRFIEPLPDHLHVMGNLSAKYLFLGQEGTISPFHTDPYDNILCQIVGFKRIRLREPADSDGRAPIHADFNSDLTSTAVSLDVVIGPGDAIIIPRGWWHHIESLSVSCSVAHFVE